MTPQEIAAKADELEKKLAVLPQVSWGNYKQVIAAYQRMALSLIELVRELALSVNTPSVDRPKE